MSDSQNGHRTHPPGEHSSQPGKLSEVYGNYLTTGWHPIEMLPDDEEIVNGLRRATYVPVNLGVNAGFEDSLYFATLFGKALITPQGLEEMREGYGSEEMLQLQFIQQFGFNEQHGQIIAATISELIQTEISWSSILDQFSSRGGFLPNSLQTNLEAFADYVYIIYAVDKTKLPFAIAWPYLGIRDSVRKKGKYKFKMIDIMVSLEKANPWRAISTIEKPYSPAHKQTVCIFAGNNIQKAEKSQE